MPCPKTASRACGRDIQPHAWRRRGRRKSALRGCLCRESKSGCGASLQGLCFLETAEATAYHIQKGASDRRTFFFTETFPTVSQRQIPVAKIFILRVVYLRRKNNPLSAIFKPHHTILAFPPQNASSPHPLVSLTHLFQITFNLRRVKADVVRQHARGAKAVNIALRNAEHTGGLAGCKHTPAITHRAPPFPVRRRPPQSSAPLPKHIHHPPHSQPPHAPWRVR